VKSSLRAILRDMSCPLSLRLSFLGGAVDLTPGPVFPFGSTLPSTSSSGRDAAVCVLVFGSLEGCVGYGRAKKYGWLRA
jgi:hypothetical protein